MKKINQRNEGFEEPERFVAEMRGSRLIGVKIAQNVAAEKREAEAPGSDPAEYSTVYVWDEIVVDDVRVDRYDALVTLLVRAVYSADAVEAANCNAAAGNTADIDEINSWRSEAKAFARTIFPQS